MVKYVASLPRLRLTNNTQAGIVHQLTTATNSRERPFHLWWQVHIRQEPIFNFTMISKFPIYSSFNSFSQPYKMLLFYQNEFPLSNIWSIYKFPWKPLKAQKLQALKQFNFFLYCMFSAPWSFLPFILLGFNVSIFPPVFFRPPPPYFGIVFYITLKFSILKNFLMSSFGGASSPTDSGLNEWQSVITAGRF